MTQASYESSEMPSAELEASSPDARDPPDLAIQTSWASLTAIASEASPQAEVDPEKGSLDSPVHTQWYRRIPTIMRGLGRPRRVQLETENALPCSQHIDPRQVIPAPRFQPQPRMKLEDLPQGYPRLAAFQASDEAFAIYRGFGYMHSRVILDLQYDISHLEQELMEIDKDDECNDRGRIRLSCRSKDDRDAKDEDSSAIIRRALMAQLSDKLLKYDEILIKAREVGTFQKPNQRDYISVTNWFNNHKPLVKAEWYSLKQQDDMITLRQSREWAMFDRWIEDLLRKCDPFFPPIGWIFRPESLREQSSDNAIYYLHPRRVEKLVAMIITAIIFILLIIPVVLMYKLTSLGNRSSTFDAVGIMIVFTLVFSAAMSLLTRAKRHELFGASAAYCAVLVVFISNFGGQSVGKS